MDANNSIRLTEDQLLHQRVMKQVLSELQGTPYVIKGGSSMIFTRDLDRHSSDLDFDSGKRLNIEGRIKNGLKAAGVSTTSIKTVKDTDTVQRYKVHYVNPETGQDKLLKIETSFRQEPEVESVEVVNGIKTYTVSQMFDLKMEAAEGRTEARDLYDLAHLVRHYGGELSSAQLDRADAYTENLDDLASYFGRSFETDDVLREFANVDDTVIAFREAVENELGRREISPELDPGSTELEAGSKADVLDAARYIAKELGDRDGSGELIFETDNFKIEAYGQELKVWDVNGEQVIDIDPDSGRDTYQPSPEFVEILTSTANELEQQQFEREEQALEIDDGLEI